MLGGRIMDYTVRAAKAGGWLRLNENDRTAAVLQSVAVLLATRQGSVPLYREFGLPQRFVDKPLNVARPLLLLEVKEALEAFVPEAELLSVDLVVAEEHPGRLQPVVKIRVRGED